MAILRLLTWHRNTGHSERAEVVYRVRHRERAVVATVNYDPDRRRSTSRVTDLSTELTVNSWSGSFEGNKGWCADAAEVIAERGADYEALLAAHKREYAELESDHRKQRKMLRRAQRKQRHQMAHAHAAALNEFRRGLFEHVRDAVEARRDERRREYAERQAQQSA